jgi:hypothetical protein
MARERQVIGSTAAILVLVTMLSACSAVRIVRVDVPDGIMLSRDQSIAYEVQGRSGTVERRAELSIRPLIDRGIKAPIGYQLYEQSGRNYYRVPHRMRGDRVVADIVAGRTYVATPALVGQLGRSLLTLCRFTIEQPHRLPADVPRICTQIFCVSERFTAGMLADRYGPLPKGISPSLELGGWTTIPQDLCRTCTRGGTLGLPIVSFVCPQPPTPACDGGTVLFSDNFDMDTVGAPPATSPAGPPSGDAASSTGDVTVVTTTSRAVRIKRGDAQPSSFEGALAPGATSTGTYCITFSGQATVSTFSPVVVSFNDASGAPAWQLIINNDQAELMTGNGSVALSGNFAQKHDIRFSVHLDVRTFDMYLNGNQVASGLALLDSSFGVPATIRFDVGQCILECFTTEYVVDDIRVSKMN